MRPNVKVGYVVEPNSEEVVKAIQKFYTEDEIATFADYIKEEKKKCSWKNLVNLILES